MDEKYEYTLSNNSNARAEAEQNHQKHRFTRQERDTEIGWLSEGGGRERERDEYNTILRQRSWQREQMYVTDGEQLSLRNEKSAGCSYHVCGERTRTVERKASRSMARLECPGIELRTLFAKYMPLDV